ncbi:hypothetical protein FOZ63_017079 [Perkinsus olseni]|uniref:Uncharacterized protein n=1 Tax=Perkinsus olseni TaxID=32597 RepID=A0A7J6QHW2_PEROL|nr:hypothetical protein FOZ63_017079 [Perkinsus olseni]
MNSIFIRSLDMPELTPLVIKNGIITRQGQYYDLIEMRESVHRLTTSYVLPFRAIRLRLRLESLNCNFAALLRALRDVHCGRFIRGVIIATKSDLPGSHGREQAETIGRAFARRAGMDYYLTTSVAVGGVKEPFEHLADLASDIYLRLDETVIPPRSVPIFGVILLDSHQGPMSLPSADSVSRRAVVVALTTLAALTAAGLYCARLNRAHAPAAMKQKSSSKGRKRERVMPFLFDGV